MAFLKNKQKYSHLPMLLILAGIGILLYSNTFHAPFFADDHSSIVDNAAVWNLQHISWLWSKCATRFLGYLSFAVNYHFAQDHVFAYHVVNLTIHCLNAFIVYFLMLEIGPAAITSKEDREKYLNYLPLLTALIFLCHPVQTQGVTYIVQRLASLATLFYLSTVFFYIKYRRGNNYAYYFAALLTALAASLTKEIAFTLPFILYVCDWIFLDQPTGARKKVWTLLPFLGIALLIPLLVHYGLPQREVLISTTRETAFFSRGEYFLTEINVIATYMRLLVVPIGQRVFYDYPIQQVLDFKTIVLFGVWAWLIAWAIRNAHRDKLRAFGILWFFITLSVESSIIPITDVIQEHRLYLPMLGFAIFLAVTLMKVVGNPDRLAKAFLTLIVIYAFLTYARNQDWQTEQGLWKDTVKKSPHSAIALSNLGEMYLLKGDFVQAKANFYEAIRIQPDPVDFINLSSIALAEKQWDKAADLAQKAMLFKQRNPAPALNNLGLAYLAQGQREKAIAIFEKARALDPGIIEPRTNLVNLYEQDQPEKALKIDEEILALKKGTR